MDIPFTEKARELLSQSREEVPFWDGTSGSDRTGKNVRARLGTHSEHCSEAHRLGKALTTPAVPTRPRDPTPPPRGCGHARAFSPVAAPAARVPPLPSADVDSLRVGVGPPSVSVGLCLCPAMLVCFGRARAGLAAASLRRRTASSGVAPAARGSGGDARSRPGGEGDRRPPNWERTGWGAPGTSAPPTHARGPEGEGRRRAPRPSTGTTTRAEREAAPRARTAPARDDVTPGGRHSAVPGLSDATRTGRLHLGAPPVPNPLNHVRDRATCPTPVLRPSCGRWVAKGRVSPRTLATGKIQTRSLRLFGRRPPTSSTPSRL